MRAALSIQDSRSKAARTDRGINIHLNPPRPLSLDLNPSHCRPRSTRIVCRLGGGLWDQCPSHLRKPAMGKVLESQQWSMSIRKGLPVTGGERKTFRFFFPRTFPWQFSDKNLPANSADSSSIPGWGRSPGGGNSNPLQHSCLENSMSRGAWWATITGSQRVERD